MFVVGERVCRIITHASQDRGSDTSTLKEGRIVQTNYEGSRVVVLVQWEDGELVDEMVEYLHTSLPHLGDRYGARIGHRVRLSLTASVSIGGPILPPITGVVRGVVADDVQGAPTDRDEFRIELDDGSMILYPCKQCSLVKIS